MKQKEPSKTFMIISKRKNLWFLRFINKYFSVVRFKGDDHDIIQKCYNIMYNYTCRGGLTCSVCHSCCRVYSAGYGSCGRSTPGSGGIS